MKRYQIISRRKHFYTCRLCSLVYINIDALRRHYLNLHPNQTFDVPEHHGPEFDDDDDDDLMNNFPSTSDTKPILNKSTLFKKSKSSVSKLIETTKVQPNHSTYSVSNNKTSKKESTNNLNSNNMFNNKLITNHQPPPSYSMIPQFAQLATVQLANNAQQSVNLHNNVSSVSQNGKISKKSALVQHQQQTLLATTPLSSNIILQPTNIVVAANSSNLVTQPYIATIYNNNHLDSQQKTVNVSAPNTFSYGTIVNNSNNNDNISHGKTEFTCEICNKAFVTMYNKRRHCKMVHNIILGKVGKQKSVNVVNEGHQHLQQQQPIQLQINQELLHHQPASTAINVQVPMIKIQQHHHHQQQQEMIYSRIQPSETANVLLQSQVTPSISIGKDKEIRCEICQKTFASMYNKRRHDDMVHKQNQRLTTQYKCSSCDKVFSSIYNKTRHENIHKPINERLKYVCQHCTKAFTTPFILKTHIQKVHNLVVYQATAT